MADTPLPVAYDKKLEGLRGFCALVVIYAHFINFYFFRTFEFPEQAFLVNIEFAHAAVLIFFVISGYVMGMNHVNTRCNSGNIISYLKKRLLRLYPIYLIALLISFSFYLLNEFSVKVFIAHLFFTQEFLVHTIKSNSPLWSLSYEVVYYILFLALWLSGKNITKVCLALAIALVAFIFLGPQLIIFKSVLTGWLFWILGLFISQQQKISEQQVGKKRILFISYFAIILSIHRFGTTDLFLQLLHLNSGNSYNISTGDLLYLPACFLIIMAVTGRNMKYINIVKFIAFTIPAFHIFLLVYYNHHLLSNLYWIYGTLDFILALIFLFVNINVSIFERLNNVGRISYALYIFHFPVFYFLNMFLLKYLSGIPLLVIGLLTSAVTIILLSVITERVLQPRIKRVFFDKT